MRVWHQVALVTLGVISVVLTVMLLLGVGRGAESPTDENNSDGDSSSMHSMTWRAAETERLAQPTSAPNAS